MKTKKLLALLLVLALMLPALSVGAQAAGTAPAAPLGSWSGSCGDGVNWALDTGTGELIISGSGNMSDWSELSQVPWYNYKNQICSVEIASGVTSIGQNAFRECGFLAEVSIPNTVAAIGSAAFADCSALENITIPGSVRTVGTGLFVRCRDLCSVTIEEGVPLIAHTMFGACEGLTSLTLPSSIRSIESQAFQYCRGLQSLTIPAAVTRIGGRAFEFCDSLTELRFTGPAPEISDNAFNGLTLTAYYPAFGGWSADKLLGYGGAVAWEKYYQPASGLWVQGVLVTEENRNDILGDGKVSYDPEYRTLTLDDRPLTDGSWTAGDGWAVYAVGMSLSICDTSGTVRLNAADPSAALAKGVWSDSSVWFRYYLRCENAVALVHASNINVYLDCFECDLEATNSVQACGFTRVRADGRIGGAAILGHDITLSGDVRIETATGDCIQCVMNSWDDDNDDYGSVTVKGDLYLRSGAEQGGDGWGIFSDGNITVEGNVDAECAAAVLESSCGDVRVDGDFRAVTGEGPAPAGKYLFPFANGTPIIAIRGSVFLWGSVDVVTEACVGVFAGNELWPCGRKIDVEATEAAFLAGKRISGAASAVIDLPVGGWVRDCTINGRTFRTFTEADEVTVAPHVILHDSVYPLWVSGVLVTEENQNDILGDGLASFNPKTNTLTLKESSLSGTYSWSEDEWGMTSSYSAVIYAGKRLGGLTVSAPSGLSLDNVDPDAKGFGVYVEAGDLSFNGDLTAHLSNAAIYTEDGSAVFNGNLDVFSTGQAIYVYGELRLNGALSAESESGTAVYVRDDLTLTGNAEIRAANGRGVFIGAGALTALADFRCFAPFGVEVQNGGFRVDGSAVIEAYSAEFALLAFGKVSVGAGVWDVYGKRYAIAAAGGIELPAGSKITQPEGGRLGNVHMSFADGKFTREMTIVTLADGTTPAKHTVIEPVWENPFVDVAEGKYYYKAVLWAYYHDPQITGGTDATHFSPNQDCTREQIVTFLWKAAGAPNPKITSSPFTDVKEGKYYFKAVLWAVQNNITGGVGDGKFGVGQPCTREQAMTFLWKAVGSPAPTTTENPFTDVIAGKYYYKAVLWAVENGVTGGVGDGKFGVGQPCTRAQIVTFLYKLYS